MKYSNLGTNPTPSANLILINNINGIVNIKNLEMT